jgi:hypothetical protein
MNPTVGGWSWTKGEGNPVCSVGGTAGLHVNTMVKLWAHESYPLSVGTQFASIVAPSLSSTLLCTQPTSTTLFPGLSKLTGSVLSFEDLTDNSMVC